MGEYETIRTALDKVPSYANERYVVPGLGMTVAAAKEKLVRLETEARTASRVSPGGTISSGGGFREVSKQEYLAMTPQERLDYDRKNLEIQRATGKISQQTYDIAKQGLSEARGGGGGSSAGSQIAASPKAQPGPKPSASGKREALGYRQKIGPGGTLGEKEYSFGSAGYFSIPQLQEQARMEEKAQLGAGLGLGTQGVPNWLYERATAGELARTRTERMSSIQRAAATFGASGQVQSPLFSENVAKTVSEGGMAYIPNIGNVSFSVSQPSETFGGAPFSREASGPIASMLPIGERIKAVEEEYKKAGFTFASGFSSEKEGYKMSFKPAGESRVMIPKGLTTEQSVSFLNRAAINAGAITSPLLARANQFESGISGFFFEPKIPSFYLVGQGAKFLEEGGKALSTFIDAGKYRAGKGRLGVAYEFGAIPARLFAGSMGFPKQIIESGAYGISRTAAFYPAAAEVGGLRLLGRNYEAAIKEADIANLAISDVATKQERLFGAISLSAIPLLGPIGESTPFLNRAAIGGQTYFQLGMKGAYGYFVATQPEETGRLTGGFLAPEAIRTAGGKWFNLQPTPEIPSAFKGVVSQLYPFEGYGVGFSEGKLVYGKAENIFSAKPPEFFKGRELLPRGEGGPNIAEVMASSQYTFYKGYLKGAAVSTGFPSASSRSPFAEYTAAKGLERTALFESAAKASYKGIEPSFKSDIPESIRSAEWFSRDLTPASQKNLLDVEAKLKGRLTYYGGTALKTTTTGILGMESTDIDQILRGTFRNIFTRATPEKINQMRVRAIAEGGTQARLSPTNKGIVEIMAKGGEEKGTFFKRFDTHAFGGEPLPAGTFEFGSGEGIGFGLPPKAALQTPGGFRVMASSEQVARYLSSGLIPRGSTALGSFLGGEAKRTYRAQQQIVQQGFGEAGARISSVYNPEEAAYVRELFAAKPPVSSIRPSPPSFRPSRSVFASLSMGRMSAALRSMGRSASPSRLASPSPSVSVSRSISRSFSPSARPSISFSTSPSPSFSISRSFSPSRSPSPSPSRSPSKSPSRSASPSPSPSPSPPFYRQPPFQPPSWFGRQEDFMRRRVAAASKRAKQKFAYSPSIFARVAGIRGRVSKSVLGGRQQLTGLELRPIASSPRFRFRGFKAKKRKERK